MTKLHDIQWLATRTGWSVGTIYNRRSRGLPLPRVTKVGALLRWREEDVDAFLAECTEA